MSKKSTMAGGSASIVIIAILFLALMGTLGVVFYQNFIEKKDTQTSQSTNETPKNEKMTTRVAYEGTIYALDYPKEWKVTTEKVKGALGSDSDTYFESKDGKVKVRFTVSSGGIGGSCDPNSPLKVTYYNVSSAFNSKLTDGETTALVEAMVDHEGGGYDYRIGMTVDSGATHAAVGDVACTVTFTGVASNLKMAEGTNTVERPLILTSITFTELTKKDGPASPDMQTIKDAMNSSYYREAVAILQSARKE